MTSEHWTHRLSEHIDGELSGAESAACEAHLSTCGECTRALEELSAVTAQASLLGDIPPARDLWPEIEGRLPPRDGAGDRERGGVIPLAAAAARRVAFSVPQLVAAAIALVLLSFGGAWMALGGEQGPASAAAGLESGAIGAGASSTPPVMFAALYEAAIFQLEVEFERRRAELNPATVRVVEENLAIIDSAIAEAGQALSQDPGSAFLNTHLANAMRQKVDLLRRVATIERIES